MLKMNPLIWSKRALPYFGCYLLYALLIALSIAVLWVWHQALLTLIAIFVGPSAVNSFIFMTIMLLIGVGLFVVVMGAEPYLRQGVVRRELWRRFLRIMLIPGSAGLLALIVEWWSRMGAPGG